MLRAYGGNSEKAELVLRLPSEPSHAAGLRLLFSLVEYFSLGKLWQEFRNTLQNVRDNASVLTHINPDRVFNMAFFMLVLTALCSRHKGFSEEKEWRAIYLPHALPSNNVERSVEMWAACRRLFIKNQLENNAEKQIHVVQI